MDAIVLEKMFKGDENYKEAVGGAVDSVTNLRQVFRKIHPGSFIDNIF